MDKNGQQSQSKKIAQLTRAIFENPHIGIGKPEGLKYDLAPKWSRRINGEHRYVYVVENNVLYVYSIKDIIEIILPLIKLHISKNFILKNQILAVVRGPYAILIKFLIIKHCILKNPKNIKPSFVILSRWVQIVS